MEQMTHQQTTIAIKEEITDTNFSLKENNVISQRAAKSSKVLNKETNETMDCAMKTERNASPPLGSNGRNDSSPNSNFATSQCSTGVWSRSSSKNSASNHSIINTNSSDSSSPPLMQSLLSSNSASDNQEQAFVTSKTTSKLKRLLSTLLQFANTLNSDIGESVKSLIFNLACNTISIEEFHNNLQDVTNFPLRPFVLPFLKTHIPILQKEITMQAKLTKQGIQQYVRYHENCVLDPFCSSSELPEVFNQTETVSSNPQPEMSNILIGKRRYECHDNNIACNKEDLANDLQTQQSPPTKKQAPSTVFTNTNGVPGSVNSQQSSYYPVDYFQIPPPPFISTGNNYSTPAAVSSKEFSSNLDDKKHTSNSEWNNIYVMLNCILSMVEKTKRALAILQERNLQEMNNADDGIHINGISNDHSSNAIRRTVAEEVKRTANELMAHTVRLTEERVAFVRKKAEEAVNEVKKQAILELQKAIASTDYKTLECGSAGSGNKLLSDNKKLFLSNMDQENGCITERIDSSNIFVPASQNMNCWNCGRKAQETCSGCNLARYCGSFCQHKDWENHHQICNGYVNSALINLEKTIPSRPTYADSFLARTNPFSDLIGKYSPGDLSNILRSQNTASDLCRLLPSNVNVSSTSTEKITVGRNVNSRPATPVECTTNLNSSSSKSKNK